ncbi:YbaN family protein [uncultured Clostridium sp.]|uniref:YbaN family protein n=1 Tax=uncultured Clostridium sp. TaxID=59620 RepID=UPI0025D912D7|nr:YbaN family protein [uncultured Clostridium sp.]
MNKMKRYMYIAAGIISVVLGSIGVVLPVLPTTPFLLLASFCFAKGSKRFDDWFKSTRLYKKHLESFVENRAMTLKQKWTLLLFADFMMMFPLIILDSLIIKGIIVMVIICKYYYFFNHIETIKE